MPEVFLTTLAQDSAPPPNVPSGADGGSVAGTLVEGQPVEAPPGGGPGSQMWLFLLLIIAVMWIFMFSGQRKGKKKRAAMLAAMAKGNRVQTVGGILGTVVEIRDDEVIVKVDENANTRLHIARSAIQTVLDAPNP
jgi:preprotein translocase subunit YajC